VRQAAAPVGQQLEAIAADRPEIPGVPLTDRAKAGHENAHVTPRPAG
jgi:hypothetical protein